MIKEDNTHLKAGGKVLNSVVDDIRIKRTKPIEKKEIPLSNRILIRLGESSSVMFSDMKGLPSGSRHQA